MLFTYNTGSKSIGSQLLKQTIVREYNSEFSASGPSIIDLCQHEKPENQMRCHEPLLAPAEQAWETDDPRMSPVVSFKGILFLIFVSLLMLGLIIYLILFLRTNLSPFSRVNNTISAR